MSSPTPSASPPVLRAVYGIDVPPGRPLDADEVATAYPWPEGTWVRAMMVTTLDGAAAGPDGLSGSVSSTADRAVFDAVRRFADAVLVGSHTLRAEEYSPMRAKPADAERRRAAGQLPAPTLAVVSGSLDLPWELPVWAESAQRPLVLTGAGADAGRLAAAREHAEVVVLPEVSPRGIVDALAGCGLPRIVCEGGPNLLRDLVAARMVDEADITVSPVFAGTGQSPTTAVLPEVVRADLVHLLAADGFLMARYLIGPR
ncbi:MAG: dihydrofolate reductase family protein [Aeromicrobium sp.]|uniref:dihydrofolate reductase family protein n=1 Tax=Aeromicrobium sp. TaxID=1871063 RepID=UPI0039E263F0